MRSNGPLSSGNEFGLVRINYTPNKVQFKCRKLCQALKTEPTTIAYNTSFSCVSVAHQVIIRAFHVSFFSLSVQVASFYILTRELLFCFFIIFLSFSGHKKKESISLFYFLNLPCGRKEIIMSSGFSGMRKFIIMTRLENIRQRDKEMKQPSKQQGSYILGNMPSFLSKKIWHGQKL